MTRERFYNQSNPYLSNNFAILTRAHIPEEWDKYISPGYFQFWAAMQRIARKTISKIDARVATMDDVDSILKEPGEAYIVPVDDDDWFHPDLPKAINEMGDNAMIRWGYWRINPKITFDQGTGFATNNVMFKKSAVKNIPNIKEVFAHHRKAGPLRNRIPNKPVNLSLSTVNHHLASITVSAGFKSMEYDLPYNLRFRRVGFESQVNEFTEWMRPYLKELDAAYHSFNEI